VTGSVGSDGTFSFTGAPSGSASTTAVFVGRVTDANNTEGRCSFKLKARAQSKTNGFMIELSSPMSQYEPLRFASGSLTVDLTLKEGSKFNQHAMGRIDFGAPNASGYCVIDLQTLSPRNKCSKYTWHLDGPKPCGRARGLGLVIGRQYRVAVASRRSRLPVPGRSCRRQVRDVRRSIG
jgi:hypothetical protein